ncbi:MTH1187 family thiamine-binding protein [Metabacillus elymi]|uniref:MTH1187 family thiamine-binding protein n=1 Tax=Metabacillus elymi TaxID=2745198 RepID=A0ABX6S8V2_9BACI|nr:MTH1187 family thiamine-binding protein [Metabacillus sp. KUDC1714]QNF29811.1 MTH1187 family thiamine-binding protein [Metabacillus sp. KUDC1714]
MPLLEISIIPIGKDSTSFSSDVTKVVRKIKEKELKYELTPTSTVVEGDIDQLWEIAKEMHDEAISSTGSERIVTNISIDHRTDKQMDMDHQINTVQNSLK